MLTGFRRQLTPTPGDPDETAKLRAENAALAQRVQYLQRHAEQADKARVAAEQQLAAQQTAAAADQIGRMQRTLHAQEDLLEGCRLAHGGYNVHASALPAAAVDPFAVCEWCAKPTSGLLADCTDPDCRLRRRHWQARQRDLNTHPLVRNETEWKRVNDR